MLRSLKQKQRKCERVPTKYIKQKCFVGVRYQNVTKLCPLFAKEIHVDVPVPTIFPRLSLANISLQYKLLQWNQVKTNGYPKRFLSFLKENVCSGYSLEAVLSNENNCFTLSRLMKRPKTFCDPARDEYSQLTFFS